MTENQRHRHRRAAYIAMWRTTMAEQKPAFTSLAEMRAATILVEMRRAAQEFEAPRFPTTRTPCKWTMPACNGTGHSGAI
jgi:hypothetical protein